MSLTWDLLWQSSLFLTVGLLASLTLRRCPARAHRALILAVIAALLTPLLSQSVRRTGWGMLRPFEPKVVRTEVSAPASPDFVEPRGSRVTGPFAASGTLVDSHRATSVAAVANASANQAPAVASAPNSHAFTFSWRRMALGSWLLLSCLAFFRLVASFLRGFGMILGSLPLEDVKLVQAASQSLTRLGLATAPELRSSPELRCPSVWCWGSRPILLVPLVLRENEEVINWDSVFCHELAHWRRLDHMWALTGQLLVCVLPWNPLAWWTKARLGQLAELACDDWVLASGLPSTDYAASLLELIPQRGASPALAAVSSPGGLVGRMKHILDDRRSSPMIGRVWASLALATTLLAASALALAQAGSASSRDEKAQKPVPSPANDPSRKEPAKMKRIVHVTVQGPDGKPIESARVLWVGVSKPALGYMALPHDHPERTGPQYKELAQVLTDEKGRVELSEEFNSGDDTPTELFVTAPGFGIRSHLLRESLAESELKLTMAPEVLIHGRLLTPAGAPAVGVRVLLNSFHNDAVKNEEGMFVGLGETDEELPIYWPRPRKTDSDGRFTIEGVPREVYANLSFWHPDFAVDEVTVNTLADGSLSPGIKAFEIVPVPPTFIHTLEPARPVQGRVTDKETGKPLAGMLIEMIPMRSHGGMQFHGRTNADGRFRISGHQANFMYITSVHPRADSGYLPTTVNRQGWPAGAKFLEVNFALEKGRLIPGRVVNRETGQPIAGAAVVYQPAPKNPNNQRTYDLRSTVLTAPDGTFKIAGLPGEGMLAVEVPDPDALRKLMSGTVYGKTAYPHGSLSVDVPIAGAPKPVELAVRKGVTIEARVVDPGGQVVPGITAYYAGIQACLIHSQNAGLEFPDGIVRIRGADPERTYHVFFIQPKRKLGTIAELKYDRNAKGPIEVRLQPTASVRGKVATGSGSVPQGCQVYALLLLNKDRKELSNQDLFNDDLAEFYSNILGQHNVRFEIERPGSNGEFSLKDLIPGASFSVEAAEGPRAARAAVPDLKPGEDRDLGTLVLKERKQ
jgi:beta-lactamase regulating signal transducer with metallopeptidase domain